MTQEATIRAMDGTSLARLAWDLNLDPRQDSVGPPVLRLRLRQDLWQPHVNLAQADAMFRQLRARRWSLSVRSQMAEETNSTVLFGVCEMRQMDRLIKVITWWSTADITNEEIDHSEAVALLRCAVLAVNAMQRLEETP